MHRKSVTVAIDGLAPGGDAVGRQRGGQADGRATFVPLAAPGEMVRVRLVRERPRVAWGELEAILTRADDSAATGPSPWRVEPRCPLFGRCGGCQWQHVAIDEQRRAKGAIVARALGLGADPRAGRLPELGNEAVVARAPGSEAGLPVAAPAGPAFNYRERARFVVGAAGEVGFRQRQSHAVVDVPRCPLLADALDSALPAIRAWARRLAPGDEIEIQADKHGRVGVVIRPAHGQGAHGEVAAGSKRRPVSAQEPGRHDDGAELSEGRRRVAAFLVDGDRLVETFGEQLELDVAEPGGRPLVIVPGAFAQVGRAANAALLEAVGRLIGPAPGRVLELYAGSGNLTRLLVERAEAVTAADGDPAAVARGARNVPEARWLVLGGAGERIGRRAGGEIAGLENETFDTVVVDPPRAGLDDGTRALAARAARQILYVSCDPQTLGRDARWLSEQGFELMQVVALDLMPQTHHVEAVARFKRR